MLNILGILYLCGGLACIIFFFVISFFSRFGLSVSWFWPAAGVALLAAALLTRFHLPQWLRYAWRAALAAGLALIGLECLVISDMHADAPAGMDYLIVLGASVYKDGPSPGLTRRINAVMNCLDKHPDALIIALEIAIKKAAFIPLSETSAIRSSRWVSSSRQKS